MAPIFIQQLKNTFIHLPLAILFNAKYGNPSKKLKIIGVTGTDGKTTTANMIYEILRDANYKVGVISTISAKFNDKEYDTGFHVTSPDSASLQKFLKLMVSNDIEWVVLECTSHGLDQNRFYGVKLDFAVVTNVTHEHIDYHRNYENYVKAKSKILDMIKPGGKIVLNKDDKGCNIVSDYARAKNVDIIFYGIDSNANVKATGISAKAGELNFKYELSETKSFLPIVISPVKMDICIPILGEYNVYNALGAITISLNILGEMESSKEIIINTLKKFKTPMGRMEIMKTKPFTVIVDFAHTPNALEKALTSTRSTLKEKGRIIVVFGCAGKRDIKKRGMMGEVAARLADVIVITAEDPRDEELAMINNQIVEGISKVKGWNMGNIISEIETSLTHLYYRFDEMSVNSRIEAIKFAIRIAKPNDIVIITGKGHEKSLCFGNTEFPYSDQEIVKTIIN
ncbi:MAG: UDP-N-acetylmuramoyl-L-alanyl-D-glutamate--2,6-diaminopimelate ligase [bacterium]